MELDTVFIASDLDDDDDDDEPDEVVEEFREFLDSISPEDFGD